MAGRMDYVGGSLATSAVVIAGIAHYSKTLSEGVLAISPLARASCYGLALGLGVAALGCQSDCAGLVGFAANTNVAVLMAASLLFSFAWRYAFANTAMGLSMLGIILLSDLVRSHPTRSVGGVLFVVSGFGVMQLDRYREEPNLPCQMPLLASRAITGLLLGICGVGLSRMLGRRSLLDAYRDAQAGECNTLYALFVAIAGLVTLVDTTLSTMMVSSGLGMAGADAVMTHSFPARRAR